MKSIILFLVIISFTLTSCLCSKHRNSERSLSNFQNINYNYQYSLANYQFRPICNTPLFYNSFTYGGLNYSYYNNCNCNNFYQSWNSPFVYSPWSFYNSFNNQKNITKNNSVSSKTFKSINNHKIMINNKVESSSNKKIISNSNSNIKPYKYYSNSREFNKPNSTRTYKQNFKISESKQIINNKISQSDYNTYKQIKRKPGYNTPQNNNYNNRSIKSTLPNKSTPSMKPGYNIPNNNRTIKSTLPNKSTPSRSLK